jgi:trans-aconitate 2-methyltransferase
MTTQPGSPWNPDQYAKFRDERSQPFLDLLSMVQPRPGGRAIDLGCGTGELTRLVHERSEAKATLGLDNSETMLAKSGLFSGNGVSFKLGTIIRFAPRKPFDLIFSNAALQWLPEHQTLFPKLFAGLAEGGQIAIQMPANNDHPSHQTAHAVAREEEFAAEMGGYQRRWPVEAPEWYAELLDKHGFREQNVRLQVYGHHLESREGVVEWVRGTLLTDYQQRLTRRSFERFLARYRERLLPQLSESRPYFYAFKRVLLWARK